MSAPRLPNMAAPSASWGPCSEIPGTLRFNEVPYAPFSKGDKLGKAADWAADAGKDGKDQKRQQYGRGFRDPYHAYGASAASSFFTNEEEEGVSAFSVVDSGAKAAPKPRAQHAVLKSRGGGRGGAATGARGGFQRGGHGGPGFQPQNPRHFQDRNPRFHGRRPGWRDYDKPQKVRDASVNIAEDWELVQSIGFNELQKLSFDVRAGEDLDSFGYVHYYNRSLDKHMVNIKLEPLDRVVHNISTSDDPVIQGLASQDTGTFFATDSIISLLMCSTKTVYPWDIVINKSNGKVFLDKREGGPLDFVSVDENAIEPPSDAVEKDNINSSNSLAFEATYINQNFSANAVSESQNNKYELDHPNPFYNEEEQKLGDPLLAHGYKYKVFNVADSPEDEPIKLVIRTEVDAAQQNAGGDVSLITVKALNEYGGTSGVLEWKNKFVNQRGAIVAAEMKNNLGKLSRWTVQSILAGASLMKIGFVSRVTPKDNTQHVIVGVLGREPSQFSSQLNLNLNNGWGIVRSVINICSELDDGKYVLLKDPNNPAIKLYKVPLNAFEEPEA
jgi:translation initiation factor 3 subunit D